MKEASENEEPVTVFVTVGTTEFNSLVTVVSSKEGLQILKDLGYTKVIIQVGKGEMPPACQVPGIAVESYRYKSSTESDVRMASLVISHAGSGSILDALGQGKPLVAVVNQDLMGNHQTELASHLQDLGHLAYCSAGTLLDTLRTLDVTAFKPLAAGRPRLFGEYLDHIMGFGSV